MQRGMRATGSGGRLQFAQVGDVSQAFAFELKINGFRVNEDLIVFQKSLTCGVLEFLSRSPLDTKAVELVASIAASKAFSSIS
jgi:hypothetical protein